MCNINDATINMNKHLYSFEINNDAKLLYNIQHTIKVYNIHIHNPPNIYIRHCKVGHMYIISHS